MRKGKYNLYNSQSIHKVYRVCTNYMYIVWSKLLDDDYKGISISLRALITHLGDKVSHHLCLRNTSLNVKWLLFYRSSQNLQCVNELWVSTVLFLNLTNRGGIHPDIALYVGQILENSVLILQLYFYRTGLSLSIFHKKWWMLIFQVNK